VAWNYAPAATNVFSVAPFDDEANKFVQAGLDRIGSICTKCLFYHAYTDETLSGRFRGEATNSTWKCSGR
jgi:hypothetical protein